MKWPARASFGTWSAAGKRNLAFMSAAFTVFGLSLIFQPRRWHSTPAYHVLLSILAAQAWGALFLVSGVSMGVAAWHFERRRIVIAALTFAFTLTNGWALAFLARYLTSPDTTPETWVSWAAFDYLLIVVAISLDRPGAPVTRREVPEVGAYRQAVEDALAAAARDRRAVVGAALDAEGARLRGQVAAACDAYAAALAAVVPAGAMPAGEDPARQALAEARNALLRAEEAYGRATGQPARPADPP